MIHSFKTSTDLHIEVINLKLDLQINYNSSKETQIL